MNFEKFAELPSELKLQIIQKCSPISYTRLRRTCRFADEFCEKYRRTLGIYCQKRLDMYCMALPILAEFTATTVYVNMTEDNIPFIQKTVSGFIFDSIVLDREHYFVENIVQFDKVLERLLETAPDLKARTLNLRSLTEHQVERVKCTWKAREVIITQ